MTTLEKTALNPLQVPPHHEVAAPKQVVSYAGNPTSSKHSTCSAYSLPAR